MRLWLFCLYPSSRCNSGLLDYLPSCLWPEEAQSMKTNRTHGQRRLRSFSKRPRRLKKTRKVSESLWFSCPHISTPVKLYITTCLAVTSLSTSDKTLSSSGGQIMRRAIRMSRLLFSYLPQRGKRSAPRSDFSVVENFALARRLRRSEVDPSLQEVKIFRRFQPILMPSIF